MKIAEKLKEMFGTNYVVKNKQVNKIIIDNKVDVLEVGYLEFLGKTKIVLDKKTKSAGVERNITLYAKELEDGTFWIQN